MIYMESGVGGFYNCIKKKKKSNKAEFVLKRNYGFLMKEHMTNGFVTKEQSLNIH